VQELAKLHWGEQVEMYVLNIVPSVLPYRLERDPKFEALWKEDYRQAEAAVDWAVQELKHATPHVRGEVRKADSVTDEIIDGIERTGADLVVMGHRGRGRVERFLLGSISESVLRHAPCSVWIVRQNESATN
jgi:nucleotide-binding universal stress UspA family protein